MSAIDLSVIAPCLNEEGNVDELVSRTLRMFDKYGIAGQLVLVDDGSTDATWFRIQRWSASDGRVLGVRHQQNRGIVPSWCSGLDASSGPRVCLIDSDLQNRPEDIERLYSAHRHDQEVVQGVRQPAAGMIRVTFSRTLSAFLNVAFRTNLRDNKSGFLLCHREVLQRILSHRYHYRYFQSFVGVSAVAHGCRIVEVDTVFDLRQSGESFLPRFPVLASGRILWELLKFRVETILMEAQSLQPGVEAIAQAGRMTAANAMPKGIQRGSIR
jgi:phenylacetate-CoA ligase